MTHIHAPHDYQCPICLGVQGVENEHTLLKQDDLVYQDDLISVFINSFWVGQNKGHVIIVPNRHWENIYDLPRAIGHRIFDVSQKVSVCFKKMYRCDGITLRQNNEPAGDQHALHYHLHVFPRYAHDNFNQKLAEKSKLADPQERKQYSQVLREYFNYPR